ncbi:hypothetical protein QQX98_010838 [Neonectria punicea]|uniref:Uncharacterized protein n=1 Tax=Neonectria punicea TaxID=979145 RepID=A0ABR1GNI6_9HYPO
MADSPKEIVTPPQEHLASVSSRQSVSQEYEGHLLASSAPDQRIAIPHDPAMPPEAALVQQMPAATVIGVMDVFPPYICGAVIKNHALNVAMVQMAFPRFPSDDCLMILTIQPNKVEYLAMALFGIHLETEDEQRYLVLQNGSRVVPSNQMSLEGAEEGAVTTILGQTISSAIQHSWKRTLEIGNAARTTRCVTMGVGMKSDAPALLNLWLGLERGVELRHKLYV